MSNFIKNWTQREIDHLAKRVRRYSFMVSSLKFLLPVAAAVIIVWLVFESNFSGGKKIFIAPPEKAEKLPETPVMTNLKYNGLDSKNQPYNLNAKEAIQISAEQADMKSITADITLANGSWASVVADTGSYFTRKKIIQLFGLVNIYITNKDNSLYQIATNGLEADMVNNITKGTGGVAANGDFGHITASEFLIDHKNSKISFTGPVKLVIVRK